MKQLSSLRRVVMSLALVGGLGVAAGACGDDNPTLQDGSMADAPDPPKTLTKFVIDLINNHSDDATPAAFADFQDLADPDGDNNNTSAYAELFL